MSRWATSSSAELITASAPTFSAFSSRAGIRSATTTLLTPADLNPIVAPNPIGPAPKITTLSDGFGWQRLTPWRATAIGSLRAATSNGMWSGTTSRLVPRTASSMSRYSASAPLAPPLPMIPLGAAIGLIDDMVADRDTGDCAADLDDLACRFVAEWHVSRSRNRPSRCTAHRTRRFRMPAS